MTFDVSQMPQAVAAAARGSVDYAHSAKRAAAAFTPAERAAARAPR